MNYGNIESRNINDLMEVIYDSGELVSANTTNSLAITSLNGNIDLEYQLITRLINGYDGAETTKLTINNDTASNYGYQEMIGQDSVAAATRGTYTGIDSISNTSASGDLSFCEVKLNVKSGYPRTAIVKLANPIVGTTVSNIYLIGNSWNNTADNVTQLNVLSSQDGGLGVGSRAILLRKVSATDGMQYGSMNVKGIVKYAWQEVYKTTLASASTAISVSGLNGNVDILYRISLRHIGGSAVTPNLYLNPNNDTGGNYGWQLLYAGNITPAAWRGTGLTGFVPVSATQTPQDYFAYCEYLLYAKTGYVRAFLGTDLDNSTGTTIGAIGISGQAWADTTNNITSLVLNVDQANGLGVGTYFCVERLNL